MLYTTYIVSYYKLRFNTTCYLCHILQRICSEELALCCLRDYLIANTYQDDNHQLYEFRKSNGNVSNEQKMYLRALVNEARALKRKLKKLKVKRAQF